MNYQRRQLLKAVLGGTVSVLGGCAAQSGSRLRCPATVDDFVLESDLGPLPVYRYKQAAGPPVVLLHELPGMSPSNLALAHCLANDGFSVYLPLLFGRPGQERFVGGYFQSCARADFECSSLSVSSPIQIKLRDGCNKIIERAGHPIGIIGMCLTGTFPLALLGDGIDAAVLCQPTLPFIVLFMGPLGRQKQALGLSEADIRRAENANTPLLALRYESDRWCPKERMTTLREIFKTRIATIEISGETHGHSTLADHFDERAYIDVVNFLKVRLGVERVAKPMNLAKFDSLPCEITAAGQWRAL
jgi:dienelactone hydrolase